MLPGALSRVYSYLRTTPELNGLLPPNGHVTPYLENGLLVLRGPEDAPSIVRWHGAMVCGSCYDRQLLSKHPFNEDSASNDWDLPARLLAGGATLAFYPDNLVARYLGEDRASGRIKKTGHFSGHNRTVLDRFLARPDNVDAVKRQITCWTGIEKERFFEALKYTQWYPCFRSERYKLRIMKYIGRVTSVCHRFYRFLGR